MTELTFKRVLRDCDFNKKDGNKRRLIYDFDIYEDGEKIGRWLKWSNRRGYFLEDIEGYEVFEKNGSAIICNERASFEEATREHRHLIPGEDEISKRRAIAEEKERIKAEHKAEERRKERIIDAAPEMLEALKDVQSYLSELRSEDMSADNLEALGYLQDTVNDAIDKAEGATGD